jgi:hypothetical protein
MWRLHGRSAVENWRARPLGIAVVDRTGAGALAIHHVAVRDDGIFLSGIWVVEDSEPGGVNDRLAHWVVTGTRDGLERVRDLLRMDIPAVDLAGLVAACEDAEENLQTSWEEYREAEPRKRANLKPLGARAWPQVAEDGDAASTLVAAGISPYPDSAPEPMRDVLAFTRLVQYVMATWWELETERTSRSYLGGGERKLFPTQWLAHHVPYWPEPVS